MTQDRTPGGHIQREGDWGQGAGDQYRQDPYAPAGGPRPQRDSVREAARINTGLPENVEATAIEIAARAYDMSAAETTILGIIEGQRPIGTENRNEIRDRAAALAVGNYLRDQGVNLSSYEGRNASFDIQAAATRVAQARVEQRQGRAGRNND